MMLRQRIEDMSIDLDSRRDLSERWQHPLSLSFRSIILLGFLHFDQDIGLGCLGIDPGYGAGVSRELLSQISYSVVVCFLGDIRSKVTFPVKIILLDG